MPDEISKVEYPGNSHKRFEIDDPKKDSKRVEKVVKGQIVKRKRSILDNFSQTFFGDDTKSVASYVLWDVLIPAAKNTISEMVSTGIEMLLFGESKGDRTKRDRGKSYVSYSNFYKDRGRDRGDRQDSFRARARHKFDDIVIESRGEAEEVLSALVDLIDNYDVATVADFYDLVGLTGEWSDNKYGWDNLNRATVNRVRDGYILVLPKPLPLD